MTIYIIVFIVFAIFAIIDLTYIKINRNLKTTFIIFLLTILFIFTAFTSSIGFDVDSYSDYDVISRLVITEPLFDSLYYICGNPRNVRIVSSLSSLILIGYIIKKDSILPFFSLFLFVTSFVLMYTMGVLRQAIALAIIMCSWRLCISNKKMFVFNVVVASLFHNSAIIALLFLLMPKDRLFKKKELLVISFFSIACYLMFFSIIDNLAGGVMDVSGKFNHYMQNDLESKPSLPLLLFRSFVVFLLYVIKVKKDSFVLANGFILTIFLSLASSASSTIGGRLVAYFSICELIVVPMFLQNSPRPMKFPLGLLMLIINGYLFFSFLNHFKDEYIPYNNWLFNLLSI